MEERSEKGEKNVNKYERTKNNNKEKKHEQRSTHSLRFFVLLCSFILFTYSTLSFLLLGGRGEKNKGKTKQMKTSEWKEARVSLFRAFVLFFSRPGGECV